MKKKDHKVTHIDKKRINKLEEKAHYGRLLEEFEILRAKLIYDKKLTKQEAYRTVTLIKYFLKNPYNESHKIHVQFLYDKYIKEYEL